MKASINVIQFFFTFNKFNVSLGAVIIIDCSSEFFPFNTSYTLLLNNNVFSITCITFLESGITICSSFMMDDLKKVLFSKINGDNFRFKFKKNVIQFKK